MYVSNELIIKLDSCVLHLPCMIVLNKNIKLKNKSELLVITTKEFKKDDSKRIIDSLNQIDWSYLNELNVNQATDEFNTVLHNVIDKIVPNKIFSVPVKHVIQEPWLTN